MPEPVTLDLATTFREMPQVGEAGERLAKRIERVSGGAISVRFHGYGSFCPPLETFEAVRSGRLDAAFSSPAYWTGANTAFALLSGSPPFGLDANGYLAWLTHGEGGALRDALYAGHDLISLPAAVMTGESAGWFTHDITRVEDFDGMTIRFFGLGAKVLERFGATIFGAGSRYGSPIEAREALASGALDGAKYLTTHIDLSFGFGRTGARPHYPPWHQPMALFDLMIRRAKWESLSASHRAMIKACCDVEVLESSIESRVLQNSALLELDAANVPSRRLPDTLLSALKREWLAVAEEEAGCNGDFADIWASYRSFQDKQRAVAASMN